MRPRKVCASCGDEQDVMQFRRTAGRGSPLTAACVSCVGKGAIHRSRTGRVHLTAEELASVVLPTPQEARAVQEAARRIRAQGANRAAPRGDDAIRAVTKDELRWCALASLAIAYARADGAIYT